MNIMQRIIQVLLTFLFVLVHAEVAWAEIPIAITLSELQQPNKKITITLPGDLKWCKEGGDASNTGQWSPNELLTKTAIDVTSSDCANKLAEIIYLAAISDLAPSTSSIKVDSKTTSLELTTSAAAGKLPAQLSHVWLEGHKFAMVCTGTNCSANLTNSRDLDKISSMTTISVSVAHEDTVIYNKDGTTWMPPAVQLSTWTLPHDAGESQNVVLSRTTAEGKPKLQTEFTIQAPYWYLLELGTFKCTMDNRDIGGCGQVIDTVDGPRVALSEEARLRLKENSKLTFTIISKKDFTLAAGGTAKSFKFSLTWSHCAFQVTQLTPLSRGVDAAQVLLEITPGTPGCAAGSWTTTVKGPGIGTVTGDVRMFRMGFPHLYVVEVTTTPSDRSGIMPLAFAYPDGEEVATNQFELRVDGRVAFSNPRILINTNVEFEGGEPQPETFTEFEVMDTIAQSRRTLIEFSQLDHPEQWRLRLPEGVQVSRCPDDPPTSRDDSPHVFPYQTKGTGKNAWQGFCVDVERNKGRTIDLRLERQSTLSSLLDAAQKSRYSELADTAIFLGTAQETVQVKQAPFNVEVDLIPRVRLVCKGDVSAPGNTEIRAFKARDLRHCALFVELEDGALAKLSEKKVPARNLKGKMRQRDKNKDATDFIDPCGSTVSGISIDSEGRNAIRRRFTSTYGQQRLHVKLWELGQNGEFAEVADAKNTITIKWNGIDAGDYPSTSSPDGGVLAFCVDLTHDGTAAKKAYDVVKLTVEHDATYYEVAWESTQVSLFTAKARRMPVLAAKLPQYQVGQRFFFSLAVPVMIRYPSTGLEAETSSSFRLANAVAFQAGVVFGTELWNFSENRPMSPIMNPQLFTGAVVLGLPTAGKPSPLAPSFIYGVGFRLPSGDDASKALEASTSLLLWGEVSGSARGEPVHSALVGFNVSIGFFGS